jgi:hypothetical protein
MIMHFKFLILFAAICCANLVFAKERKPVIGTVSIISQNTQLKTREKRDIVVIRVPAVNQQNEIIQAKFRFYIQGALHGDEKLTTEFVVWLVDRVLKGESELNKIPADLASFDFVPVANPDGAERNSRYNSKLVNLNRNFGILWGKSKENPGTDSFSEPETQAIRYLFETQKYTAAIDVHGYVNWIVAPSSQSKNNLKQNIYAKNYQPWIDAIKANINIFDKYELKTAGELGDGGAFEDWAFWENGTLSFCLELASPYRHKYMPDPVKVVKKIDQFLTYEKFVFKMFEQAIEISKEPVAVSVAN